MKKTILYTLGVVALAMVSISASAQKVVEGQVEVRDLSVINHYGDVKIDMNVDISQLTVGGDETIVLTPVLAKEDNTLELPAIEIMGRRAWLYWWRNGEKSVTESPLYVDREATRAERKAGEKQVLAYKTVVAYEPWMSGATIYIKEGSCGCCRTPLALGNTPLEQVLRDKYEPNYLLAFVEPNPEPVKVREESHTAYINFWVDRYVILENYRNNKVELASILNSIDRVHQDEDLTITSITIEGWASPEATQAHNKVLSQNRANSLADYVSQKCGVERSRIEAIGRGEDWVGLRKLVDATPGLLYRDKVYALIDDPRLTLDEKDYRLSQLKPSDIYTRLMNEMYPKLRRNDYRIVYSVRNFNLEEARAILDKTPYKLSIDEMYQVAGCYERGSKEYQHVMDVAAKTYPHEVAAAVNAAVARLNAGDCEGALKALKPTDQNDANVQLTMGYAHAVCGNYDEAREFWQKAAAQGLPEAQHNLNELAKSLE